MALDLEHAGQLEDSQLPQEDGELGADLQNQQPPPSLQGIPNPGQDARPPSPEAHIEEDDDEAFEAIPGRARNRCSSTAT